MELRKGLVGLHNIFLGAFDVAFRSVGAVIVLIILIHLMIFAIGGFMFWIGWLNPTQILTSIVLLSILVTYLTNLMYMGVLRILESKADREGRPTPEALTGSLLPAFYMLLISVAIMLLQVGLTFILSSATSISQVFTLYIIVLLLMLFFVFVPQALALRAQNPLTAIVYSFQLVKAHFLRVLAVFLGALAIPAAFIFFSLAAISTYLIPYLVSIGYMRLDAGWEQFMNLPGILFFAAMGLIAAYLALVVQAAWVVLFLNLDFIENFGASDARATNYDATFIPKAELMGEQVEVLQSSVSAETNHEMQQHLDQVYSDVTSKLENSGPEEDRMPTILFDENMAQEIAKTKQFWDEKTKKQQELEAGANAVNAEEDTKGVIKMSQLPKRGNKTND